MVNRFPQAYRLCESFWVVLAALSLMASSVAAQNPASDPADKVKPRSIQERLLDKPSVPPAFSIPIDPLGFAPPGPIYLGQRMSHVSLDFLDEGRLLLTFRVPGLLHRENSETDDSDVRQIRALVLTLPSGAVEAEALWNVHDRARYLWMLSDGHFLLRDRNLISQGDRTLELKPFLQFPGRLIWLETDPAQRYLVTNSHEPVAAAKMQTNVGSPATALADVQVGGEKQETQPDIVLRILHRDTGQVMLVSRVRTLVHLPLNSDGYLETLRGNGEKWTLNLNYFSGGSTPIGTLDSACTPGLDFMAQRLVLASTCSSSGGRSLVGMEVGGRKLWEDVFSTQPVWPIVVSSPDGRRLIRENLAVNHTVSALAPLDSDDIKGQLVQVLNGADGKVVLATTASPVLDVGGNVAISPSGQRVAVINAGSIQVFELPAPPPIPGSRENEPGR